MAGAVGGRAAVLIAEDSATQAERLRAVLEEAGYEVEVARSGTEALASARARPPAFVISDVLMPEMDGYALCRAIKSDDALRDTPVVLHTSLSSRPTPGTRQRSKQRFRLGLPRASTAHPRPGSRVLNAPMHPRPGYGK